MGYPRTLSTYGIGLGLCAAAAFSQAPSPSPSDALVEGRLLVSHLRLDPEADAPLFAATGRDRTQTLLQAVLDRGQEPSATPEDWKNMHRAAEGFTELAVANGETLRAAVYQLLQNNFYAQLDGDYARALGAARRSLALQEQSGVTGTLYLPHSAIGHDLAALGRTEEALAEYRSAVQLDTDPMHPSAAQRRRDVVQAEVARGRIDEARREQEALWQTAQRAGGLFRARALLAKADVELAAGATRAATDAVIEAGALVTDPSAKSAFDVEAVSVLAIAVLDCVNAASYSDALGLANHIAQAMPGLPIDIPAFARRATLVRRRNAGDLDGVLRDLSESLAGAKLRQDVPAQIYAWNAIAATYFALHARSQRAAALEAALALQPAAPVNYSEAYAVVNTLTSLGAAYADLADERASAKFSQALKVIQVLPAVDQRRLEGAASEARIGQARTAEIDQDIDTARDILQSELKRHPESASAALAWARLERNAREHTLQAGELYERAIGLLSEQKQTQAEIAIRLEYARYLVGDGPGRVPNAPAKAHAQAEAAAAALHAMEYAEGQWQLAYTRGVLAEGDNDPAAAIAAYRAAIDKMELLRSAIGDAGRRQAFSDSRLVQDLYARLVALCASRRLVADAWDYVERHKARAFLETLSGHASAGAAPDSAEWREAKQIEEQVASLRTALTVPESVLRGAGRSPAALRVQLTALETRYAEIRERATLSNSAPPLHPGVSHPSLERMRAALPADAALIEYTLLPGKLGAFIITRSGVKLRTWPAAETAIESKSLRLWRALQTDQDPGLEDATSALSTLVIHPIAADLPSGVKRLIFVPASWLQQIPFQCLRLPDGAYVVDRFDISYLPSGAALEPLSAPGKTGAGQLLAAIGAVSSEGAQPLPGTLREVAGIAAIDRGARQLREAEFTHDAALAALRTYDRVHFATHGLLDPDAPLFSALLTSPTPGQSSRVSLYELASLRIRSRFVVLSACQTARGKFSGGDETVSLTRTLLSSGARTIVSSLWQVSDESTALVMQAFYRAMDAGNSPAAAMRAAELEIRHQYPSPFYWAPFLITGAD